MLWPTVSCCLLFTLRSIGHEGQAVDTSECKLFWVLRVHSTLLCLPHSLHSILYTAQCVCTTCRIWCSHVSQLANGGVTGSTYLQRAASLLLCKGILHNLSHCAEMCGINFSICSHSETCSHGDICSLGDICSHGNICSLGDICSHGNIGSHGDICTQAHILYDHSSLQCSLELGLFSHTHNTLVCHATNVLL